VKALDAAIEIPSVFALVSHLGIHLSQCCGCEQQAKRKRYQELFHRSSELDRCKNSYGTSTSPYWGIFGEAFIPHLRDEEMSDWIGFP
jgi:hypothetical protein